MRSIKTGGNFFNSDRNNFGPQIGFAWNPKRVLGTTSKTELCCAEALASGLTAFRDPDCSSPDSIRRSSPIFRLNEERR